jgi:hypothetical protein
MEQIMPSGRKQVNVRVDDESEKLMASLLPAIRDATGIPVTVSDLFRMGLHALKERYLSGKKRRKGGEK